MSGEPRAAPLLAEHAVNRGEVFMFVVMPLGLDGEMDGPDVAVSAPSYEEAAAGGARRLARLGVREPRVRVRLEGFSVCFDFEVCHELAVAPVQAEGGSRVVWGARDEVPDAFAADHGDSAAGAEFPIT